jgi:hypothetical protein
MIHPFQAQASILKPLAYSKQQLELPFVVQLPSTP